MVSLAACRGVVPAPKVSRSSTSAGAQDARHRRSAAHDDVQQSLRESQAPVEEVEEESEDEVPPIIRSLSEELAKIASYCRPVRTPPKWLPPWQVPQQEPIAVPQPAVAEPNFRPHLLAHVLNRIIPASLKDEDKAALKRLDSQLGPTAKHEELVAFKHSLCRLFGNLGRAIRGMRNAALMGMSPKTSRQFPCGLAKADFEWCVTSFLRYGDRRLARRLFAVIDRNSSGHMDVTELLTPSRSSSDGLVSIFEFKRSVMQRFGSLARAFREFEEAYVAQASRRMLSQEPPGARRQKQIQEELAKSIANGISMQDFMESASFFHLEPLQAAHIFTSLDVNGDGQLTMEEFLENLTELHDQVTVGDFRHRMLAKFPTMQDAIRDIRDIRDLTGTGQPNSTLTHHLFTFAMARYHISEPEATEIFKAIDSDGSGELTVDEFRHCIRECNPPTSVDSFWIRFAAEWPEIVDVAKMGCEDPSLGDDSRRRIGCMLAELLPQELRETHARAQSPLLGRRSKSITGHGPTRALSPQPCLESLTLPTFDALAAMLDICSHSAADIFMRLARAHGHKIPSTPDGRRDSAGHRRPSRPHAHVRRLSMRRSSISKESSPWNHQEIFIEDFAEQLYVITGHVLAAGCTEGSGSHHHNLRQGLAPARAAISALKAELEPEEKDGQASTTSGHEPGKVPGSKSRTRLKLPWVSYRSPVQPRQPDGCGL